MGGGDMQKPMLWVLRRFSLAGKLAWVAASGLLAMVAMWGSTYFALDSQVQLAVVVVGGACFLYVLYGVYRNMAYEIGRLLSAMDEAAQGNLTHRITASGKDELADMARCSMPWWWRCRAWWREFAAMRPWSLRLGIR